MVLTELNASESVKGQIKNELIWRVNSVVDKLEQKKESYYWQIICTNIDKNEAGLKTRNIIQPKLWR